MLDLDVEGYGRWLLDWLYDQPESQRVAEIAQAKADGQLFIENMLYAVDFNDTGLFFARLGLPGITGHPVVARLMGQGWVDTDSQFAAEAHLTLREDGSDPMEQDDESPRARITPAGIEVARRNRAGRRDAVPADTPLTMRMLRWLYRETVSTENPADLVNFLPSDYAIRNGSLGFILREAQDAARYLHEKALVTYPGSQPVRGLGQQLVKLTPAGRECHNGYDANVSQYLGRGNGDPAAAERESDPVVRLRKLQELRDAGLLTPREYEVKRSDIINSI